MARVKMRRRATNAKNKHWGFSQKVEAVTLYNATRSPTAVCATYQIPMDTFASWKKTEWFKEMLLQIQQEDDGLLDAKMSTIVKKTLKTIEDRVDNGNFVIHKKTGEMVRVPISAKEATQVASTLLDKRTDIRDAEVKKVDVADTQAHLTKLMSEFSKFAKSKTIEGEFTDAPKA